MAFITRDQILGGVKFNLSLTHTTQHDIQLLELIRIGARRIGYGENIIMKCDDIEIVDGRVALPCDMNRLLVVFPYNRTTEDDEDDTTPTADEITQLSTLSPNIYVETAFGSQFGMTSYGMPSTYQVINDTIHFNSTVEATDCKIVYKAYNRDDNDIPMIHEDAEEALINYASWKFAVRFDKNYSPMQIADWKRDWVAQKARVVGLSAQRSFFKNMPEIQSIMKALVTTKKLYG